MITEPKETSSLYNSSQDDEDQSIIPLMPDHVVPTAPTNHNNGNNNMNMTTMIPKKPSSMDGIPIAQAVTVTPEGQPQYSHTATMMNTTMTTTNHHHYDSSFRRQPYTNVNSQGTTLDLDEDAIKTLQDQGYSMGLIQSLQDVKTHFAKRIFIIDNSGSMQTNDGHRLVDMKYSHSKKGVLKMVRCSRWEEVRETINYHIRLTGLIHAPTSFRLLNYPSSTSHSNGFHHQRFGTQIFSIAEQNYDHNTTTNSRTIHEEITTGIEIMRCVTPNGCTPLTDHIRSIYHEVLVMTPDLRAKGQRISITIATDGLPSDPYGKSGPHQNRTFVNALRQLEGLPVWLVIRLCTDEESVVEFYNDLDTMLEVSVEVLDDFIGEAKEIHEYNPWLNYGLPLHRLRELGYHDRLFDMLDERPFTICEIGNFCNLLLGGKKDTTTVEDGQEGVGGRLPDPCQDWKGFVRLVEQRMKKEDLQWNPMTRRTEPWINLKRLDFLYGDSCNHMPCHPLQLFHWFSPFLLVR